MAYIGNAPVIENNLLLNYKDSTSDATANGGGITLKGTSDKTIIWDTINKNWTSSESFNLKQGLSYKLNNISVLTVDSAGSYISGVVTNLTVNNTTFNTTKTTITQNNISTAIDTFDITIFRTTEYIVEIKQNTNYVSTKILLTHDGTNVYLTEYGRIWTTSNIGKLNAAISGNVLSLRIEDYGDASVSNIIANVVRTNIKI